MQEKISEFVHKNYFYEQKFYYRRSQKIKIGISQTNQENIQMIQFNLKDPLVQTQDQKSGEGCTLDILYMIGISIISNR